jgi:hypothetical protein
MVRTAVLPLHAILAGPFAPATAAPAWRRLRAEVEGYAAAACLTEQE